jgi:alpha-1,3-glucosyltransferase
MFGDFEAQRHWMELTINLPINEWLENNNKKTSSNDFNFIFSGIKILLQII